jgi:hypothetical protein
MKAAIGPSETLRLSLVFSAVAYGQDVARACAQGALRLSGLFWALPRRLRGQFPGLVGLLRTIEPCGHRHSEPVDGANVGAQVRRTAGRPLPFPSGRVNAREALLFGVLLSAAGGIYLQLLVKFAVGCACSLHSRLSLGKRQYAVLSVKISG